MITTILCVAYGVTLVGGLLLINASHHRYMTALRAAHQDRLWLIDLCARAGDARLGNLVVDTAFDAHIEARRRGKEWLTLYPETIQNLAKAYGRGEVFASGVVVPFKGS